MEIYQQIPLRHVDVELSEALELATDLNSYANDAYLLHCAAKYRAPLLTLDKQLAQLAKQKGIKATIEENMPYPPHDQLHRGELHVE